MSGSIVDLHQPGVSWPDPIALDTNVVIAFLQQSFPGQTQTQIAQAGLFFQQLVNEGKQAVLTPTAYSELMHVAVRRLYQRLVRGNTAALSRLHGMPITDWMDLFKVGPSPLQRFRQNLTAIRQGLVANNVVIAGPEDLDFVTYPAARHYSDELIDRMVRYGLDTSDALITLEASSLGIDAIVSMDRDMQRARSDFDVYIWL